MKMRMFMLLGISAVLVFSLYHFRDYMAMNPLQHETNYVNISKVTTGEDASIYTISNSKKSIQKVNESGELVYELSTRRFSEADAIRLFDQMAADAQGNLYVSITVLDQYGLYVIGEEMIKISADGSTIRSLYEEEYEASERLLRAGKVQSMSAAEDSLFFFKREAGSASLYKLTEDAEQSLVRTEEVRTFTMPESQHLFELAGSKENHFFFSTRTGSLFAVTGSGMTQLFPNTEDVHMTVPVRIHTRDHTHIYFIDNHEAAVKRLNSAHESYPIHTLISYDQLTADYPDISWTEFTDISVSPGLITVATSDHIIQLLPNGEIIAVKDGYRHAWGEIAAKIAYWLAIVAALLLILLTIRYFYIHIMKRRTYLLMKQLLLIIPVVLVSMIGLSYSVYGFFSAEMKSDALQQMKLLASNGKYLVEGAHFEQLQSPRDYMNEDYRAIRQAINDVISQSSEEREGLYTTLYRYQDGGLYIIMDDNDSVEMYQPFEINEENLLVLEHGQVVSGEWTDTSGQWIYAMGPLYNSSGEIIGIYETGKDLNGMQKNNMRILRDVITTIAWIALLLIIVISIMTAYLLSSIGKLRRNVNLIARGELDVKVQIRTRDEVQELGERFNLMTESIRRYIEEVTKLSQSYFRFVPQQFLKVLGKSNMTEIELGEQAKRFMTILVCDMRNFTEFSNSLSTEDNFRFINRFLRTFGPVIREHGGFTSRYLGAGMLSMFANQPDQALKAAVKLREMLAVFNDTRQKEGKGAIDIGIAIHSGDVMLGIIGEEQRMEGSVVSNEVQTALDLQKLSAKLGANILLTEDTLHAVKAMPGKYRRLGTVQLADDQPVIELYDLYEADPQPIRDLKHETQKQFEEAVRLFQNGRFYDAREGFVNVVRKNRDDLAAKLYFFACDRYYQEGVSAQWNQSLRIS